MHVARCWLDKPRIAFVPEFCFEVGAVTVVPVVACVVLVQMGDAGIDLHLTRAMSVAARKRPLPWETMLLHKGSAAFRS